MAHKHTLKQSGLIVIRLPRRLSSLIMSVTQQM